MRSAAEPIDDTSTGKLMEGVLAAFAQFDNDVRSDRMRADMKAALELGRWVFPGADRLLERSAVNRQELDPRSGAGRARATGVRGVRQRTLHEGTAAQAGARLGSDQPPRSAAHIAGDRHAPGNQLYAVSWMFRVRCSRKARRLRSAHLRGPVLPRAGGAIGSRAEYDATAACVCAFGHCEFLQMRVVDQVRRAFDASAQMASGKSAARS